MHILKDGNARVDCGDYCIYGNNISPELDDRKINILLLHADLDGSGEYEMVKTREIENSGFDYVALSHVHSYSGIKKCGGTHFAYCGVPMAGGFDEQGEKGCIAGTVGKGECNLSFIPILGRRYYEVNIELDREISYEDIEQKIYAACDDKGALYKCVLNGTVSRDFLFNADVLKSRMADKFYFIKFIPRFSAFLPIEEMADEYSLKGIFIKKMLKYTEGAEDKELAGLALEYGIKVLEGREVEV